MQYTWSHKRDGSQGHKHQLAAGEGRTLCGMRASDGWIRGELETRDEACTRCEAAAVNMGARMGDGDPGEPAAVALRVRSELKKAMARADWALTAWYAAGSDADLAAAALKVRATAGEVDRLYSEFGASFRPALEMAAEVA